MITEAWIAYKVGRTVVRKLNKKSPTRRSRSTYRRRRSRR